ncbi:MAG: hypothetical protein AAGJ32_02700 [Pseudomonadota bacterium]
MDWNALKLVDMAAALKGHEGAGSARQNQMLEFPYHMGTKGVHEIAPAEYGDGPAALGFALTSAVAPEDGACLWVREDRLERDRGQPCADGLRTLGIDPGRLMVITARKTADALWAIEEAMKSHAAGLVLAEISGLDFTASRRLALASETHGAAAVLVLPHTLEGASAATTRWRVSALPSAPNSLAPEQLGALRWQAVLERARNAPFAIGRSHGLEFNHETLSLDLVPGLAAGQTPPPQTDTPADILTFARTG